MMKINSINLSPKAIDSLKKVGTYKKFSTDTSLYYKGQVPIVACFIVRGNILLRNGNKDCHQLQQGCLFGHQELSQNLPSPYTAEILGNTEIYYLDKSTLLEIKSSKNAGMRQLYSELASSHAVM